MKRTASLRRRRPLRSRSRKREALYRKRRPLVARLLAERPVCEVPFCPNRSEHPHERLTRARGGSIVAESNIVMLCASHHREVHERPLWAHENGWLKWSWEA